VQAKANTGLLLSSSLSLLLLVVVVVVVVVVVAVVVILAPYRHLIRNCFFLQATAITTSTATR